MTPNNKNKNTQQHQTPLSLKKSTKQANKVNSARNNKMRN